MSPWLGLDRLLFLLIRAFMRLCTRATALPADPEELQLDPNKPVVYVMRDRSVADAAVVHQATRKQKLVRAAAPRRPARPLAAGSERAQPFLAGRVPPGAGDRPAVIQQAVANAVDHAVHTP